MAAEKSKGLKQNTILTHAGRTPAASFGTVNTPVYRASTILFPTLEALDNKEHTKLRYGRRGTPTTHALEDAMCEIEQGDRALITPSGTNALAVILTTYAEPGAHFLIMDNAYAPTRKFCSRLLSKFGVETTFYDPTIGAGIESLIRPETKLIFMEAPGSQTFEVHDIAAIVDVAKRHQIATAIDNTWSGGYFCQPIQLGVDISIQSGTKYLSGHADVMLGTIVCTHEHYDRLRDTYLLMGVCVSPDDAWLVLRGLRTLGVRLRQHDINARAVADWLAEQPEVLRLMHPGREGDAFHDLWMRYFTGASGLFGFIIGETDRSKLARLFDGLSLIGMGSSWGGFETLMIPTNPTINRTATRWAPEGQTMRIHVGLEDPEDIIREIRDGFDRMQ
jgi:cystathionine beta-lyase, bacterial